MLCNIDTGKITVSKDIELTCPGVSHNPYPYSPGDAHSDGQSFGSLSLGRSSTANSLNKVDDKSKDRDSDTEFMNDVMAAIQGHYGEAHVRAKFQDYVGRFVRLAAVYEEDVYHQTKIAWPHDSEIDTTGLLGRGLVFPDTLTKQKELATYACRIEGWRQTISYRYYQKVRIVPSKR